MTIARIEGLLRETMGLDAASIGPSSIDRAVRSRMIACNDSDTSHYWERIQASPAEAVIGAAVARGQQGARHATS